MVTDATQTEVEILLVARDERTSTGILQLEYFGSGRRFLRSVIRGVLGLILTGLFIFIPILHFILVPLGLVAAVLVSLQGWRLRQIILSGQGTCPYCGAEFRILRRSFQLPFEDICERCSRQVVIQMAGAEE